MSTIKSSTEHLTLNADGAGKEIKFQANGVEKAKVTSTGIDVTGSVTCDGFTSTGIDDNATSTAMTIDSGENVSFTNRLATTELSTDVPSLYTSGSQSDILIGVNGVAGIVQQFDTVTVSAGATVNFDYGYQLTGMLNIRAELAVNAGVAKTHLYSFKNRYGSVKNTLLATHNGSTGGANVSVGFSANGYYGRVSITNNEPGDVWISSNFIGH